MTDRRASLSIRMPRELLEQLKAEADTRSHSMNAEIVQRLERSFQEKPNDTFDLNVFLEKLTDTERKVAVTLLKNFIGGLTKGR